MIGTVIIHGPDQLFAVYEASVRHGCPIRVVTAEWAGTAYGALYWAKTVDVARSRHPSADVTVALHCGDDAGRALAALREGWKLIVLTSVPIVRDKMTQIAAQQKATVMAEPDDGYCDLSSGSDVLDAWIESRRRCK